MPDPTFLDTTLSLDRLRDLHRRYTIEVAGLEQDLADARHVIDVLSEEIDELEHTMLRRLQTPDVPASEHRSFSLR